MPIGTPVSSSRSQIACNWPPAPPRNSGRPRRYYRCRGPQYIPTECWFIQKFKDEISVIGAQVPQEEPFGIENIHLPISVPYRVQLTPRGWCKVAAYDILRRKEVVKIRTTSPDSRKAQ